MVQWLTLHASSARGADSLPGWGTKILHAMWHGQENILKIKFKNKNCTFIFLKKTIMEAQTNPARP